MEQINYICYIGLKFMHKLHEIIMYYFNLPKLYIIFSDIHILLNTHS